ncbi:hypothetical protein IY145_02960 [Methylosinus sp. H3A]|uniref:hypothetical protein n=1 Tax=Methylosinus sp. H3A TaxID=2785786 RepID=UPI0018C236CE|nr:hypothetical protein [Methylosinus sp. H3A]MBG0808335.1 hypothetical protein [Methylosinus sp. H3A]
MNKVISVTEKRRLSEFAHALVTRARAQAESETSSELPPLSFTGSVSTMDSLLLHLTEQRNYLLKFSAQISAQVTTLSSTIDRLSTEIAKVAGEVDGLRRERTTLQQALEEAKQEVSDVAEAVVVGVTQQLEQHMKVFEPLTRSDSSAERKASGG